MHAIKILKRKDASSIVVAVLLSMILYPLLLTLTADLSAYLSGITNLPDYEWRIVIVQPIVSVMLQLVLLEAILRIAVFIRPFFVRRVTRSSKSKK